MPTTRNTSSRRSWSRSLPRVPASRAEGTKAPGHRVRVRCPRTAFPPAASARPPTPPQRGPRPPLQNSTRTPALTLFGAMNCDGCHGGGGVGWVQGPSLADGRWRYGGTHAGVVRGRSSTEDRGACPRSAGSFRLEPTLEAGDIPPLSPAAEGRAHAVVAVTHPDAPSPARR